VSFGVNTFPFTTHTRCGFFASFPSSDPHASLSSFFISTASAEEKGLQAKASEALANPRTRDEKSLPLSPSSFPPSSDIIRADYIQEKFTKHFTSMN
jgi:hypothetical protein